MKSTRVRILTIGAAVMLAVAVALAQGMHGHHGGPGGDFHRMLRQLDRPPTNTPREKRSGKEKPAMQPLMEQMHQNHTAMRALEANGTFDEAKTRAVATQNSQAMIELQVEHARIKSEIMQILTPEQKTKLAQIEANHEARMQKHGPPPAEQ